MSLLALIRTLFLSSDLAKEVMRNENPDPKYVVVVRGLITLGNRRYYAGVLPSAKSSFT